MVTRKNVAKFSGYSTFLHNIKERIRSAQYNALKTVNKKLITLYWDIGKMIVEKQKRLGWGESVIDHLSQDLLASFPDVTGFSPRNLRDMKRFFVASSSPEFWRQAVAKMEASNLRQTISEIPWGQHLTILNKVVNPSARIYYMRTTAGFGWSRSVLLNQIKAGTYERELENRLIERLREFILELGYGFCFVGRQHRLTLGQKEYFIDLLFYHRFLKALVAFELKVGPFEPEYTGKMDFYLNLLNDKERASDDNQSIGIILCAEKDDVEVEYALKTKRNPIGVAAYQLQSKLPGELKGKLPTAKQLSEAIRPALPERNNKKG